MPDSSFSLTTLAAYGGAMYSFDRITNGRNRYSTAYIGWADCGRAFNGTCFTEWDVGAFLAGDYKGEPTNPILRFTGNGDQAVYNFYQLNRLGPDRPIATPNPGDKNFQGFVDESRNLFNWATRKNLPSYINRPEIKTRGAKNKYLFGKDGVAWVSADNAGKTYVWRGNNSVINVNGRPSLDVDQAFGARSDIPDGNQLNFWLDSAAVDSQNNIGISDANLRMDTYENPKVIDLKLLADPIKVNPAPRSSNQVTNIEFTYFPADRDVQAFNFGFEETNTSQTKLISSITNENETIIKNTLAIKVAYNPEGHINEVLKFSGMSGEISNTFENQSRSKTVSMKGTETTETKTVGQKFTYDFRPSAIKPNQPFVVTQSDGRTSSYRMTPGFRYRAYITIARGKLSSSIDGLSRYSGSFGITPLISSFFGSSDDNVQNHSTQSPAISDSSVRNYIDQAVNRGRVNEVLGLPKIDQAVNGAISKIDQVQIDDQGRLVTNLLWSSEDNLETNVSFNFDQITKAGQLTLIGIEEASATNKALLTDHEKPQGLKDNAKYLEDAYQYFANTIRGSGAFSAGQLIRRPSSALQAISSYASLEITQADRLFVKPLESQAIVGHTALSGDESIQGLSKIGQSLQLNYENSSAIGLLQRDLNVFGTDQTDRIMITGGNTADSGIGDDLLINYAEPGNLLPAYLTAGKGNDLIVANGGITVASAGEGDDNAYARGRFSFYGESGEDTLRVDDLTGEKFFPDFDLFEDDVVISSEVLKDLDDIGVNFDHSHLTLELNHRGKRVLLVSLGHELHDVIGVDYSGELSKDDVLAYVISESQNEPLSRGLARSVLTKYFSNKTDGTEFFLESFRRQFSDDHDVWELNEEDIIPDEIAPIERTDTKAELIRAIRQAPVIESALSPWLKLISPDAESIVDLKTTDLQRIYAVYKQVLSLYESNIIYSSSGGRDDVLSLAVSSTDPSIDSSVPSHWDSYSDLSVSLVAGFFKDKFPESSKAFQRDALTGNLMLRSDRFAPKQAKFASARQFTVSDPDNRALFDLPHESNITTPENLIGTGMVSEVFEESLVLSGNQAFGITAGFGGGQMMMG